MYWLIPLTQENADLHEQGVVIITPKYSAWQWKKGTIKIWDGVYDLTTTDMKGDEYHISELVIECTDDKHKELVDLTEKREQDPQTFVSKYM